MKKSLEYILSVAAVVGMIGGVCACNKKTETENKDELAVVDELQAEDEDSQKAPEPTSRLAVYSWGDYIDPAVIQEFEKETGIAVDYDMFDTNEEMFESLSGGKKYDVLCPSDYMIQKLIQHDMLSPLNYDHIPNIKNIDPNFMEMAGSFDEGNKFAVPYTWGTVGIIYNTKRIEDKKLPVPKKWADLWNPAYKDEIIMQDSIRDAYMVALKSLGYSMNSTNEEEIQKATQKLIEQKPLVRDYVVDEVRNKMIDGEAAIGVIYSGELMNIQEEVKKENYDYSLEYVFPEEGTNVWMDAWVVLKDSENKENAEKWIDFLARADIAKRNFEFITYATPNMAALELLDEKIRKNKSLFPDGETFKNCEVYRYPGEDVEAIYKKGWAAVKGDDEAEVKEDNK